MATAKYILSLEGSTGLKSGSNTTIEITPTSGAGIPSEIDIDLSILNTTGGGAGSPASCAFNASGARVVNSPLVQTGICAPGSLGGALDYPISHIASNLSLACNTTLTSQDICNRMKNTISNTFSIPGSDITSTYDTTSDYCAISITNHDCSAM